MKLLKLGILVFCSTWLLLPVISVSIPGSLITTVTAQFSVDCDPPAMPCVASEAATGFDDQSIDQAFVTNAVHNQDQLAFEEQEFIPDGLGPVYNAQSCAECHQTTVTGGPSQIVELRAGVIDETGAFLNPCVVILDDAGNKQLICNRSLINFRAICPAGPLQFTIVNGVPFNHPNANVQERIDNIVHPFTLEPVPEEQIVSTFRLSLSTLGDGLVECVNSNTLAAIANSLGWSYFRGHECCLPLTPFFDFLSKFSLPLGNTFAHILLGLNTLTPSAAVSDCSSPRCI